MAMNGRKLSIYLSAERLAVLRRYHPNVQEALRLLIDSAPFHPGGADEPTVDVLLPSWILPELRLALANSVRAIPGPELSAPVDSRPAPPAPSALDSSIVAS